MSETDMPFFSRISATDSAARLYANAKILKPSILMRSEAPPPDLRMAEFGQIMPSYPEPSAPKEKSENAAASVFETAHAAAPSPNTHAVERSEGSRIF